MHRVNVRCFLTLARHMTVDVLRALCVLALIFLVFGHKPVLADGPMPGAYLTTSLNSYCGDTPDGAGGHAPCHACRLFVGLDLPPPPAMPVPAYRAVVAFAYVLPPPAPVVLPDAPRAHPPRAPPLA